MAIGLYLISFVLILMPHRALKQMFQEVSDLGMKIWLLATNWFVFTFISIQEVNVAIDPWVVFVLKVLSVLTPMILFAGSCLTFRKKWRTRNEPDRES